MLWLWLITVGNRLSSSLPLSTVHLQKDLLWFDTNLQMLGHRSGLHRVQNTELTAPACVTSKVRESGPLQGIQEARSPSYVDGVGLRLERRTSPVTRFYFGWGS